MCKLQRLFSNLRQQLKKTLDPLRLNFSRKLNTPDANTLAKGSSYLLILIATIDKNKQSATRKRSRSLSLWQTSCLAPMQKTVLSPSLKYYDTDGIRQIHAARPWHHGQAQALIGAKFGMDILR